MTLADVAARCSPPTTAQTIGRLETGMRNLSLIWMNRIAAALGVEPELLVRGDEAPQPQDDRPAHRRRCRGADRAARRDAADCAGRDRRGGRAPGPGIEAGAGEYRAGDQLWLREVPADDWAQLVNRDVLAPRAGGRFVFGRLVDRDAARVAILPPGPGQRQVVVENPPGWRSPKCSCAPCDPLLRVLSLSTLFPSPARPVRPVRRQQPDALARRAAMWIR